MLWKSSQFFVPPKQKCIQIYDKIKRTKISKRKKRRKRRNHRPQIQDYKIYLKKRSPKQLEQQGTDSSTFQDNFIPVQSNGWAFNIEKWLQFTKSSIIRI